MKSHIGQKRAAWWFAHVAQWRQSDMSKAGYCNKHSLNLSSFRYRLRKSSYARNQWSRVVRYVDCELFTPDNNEVSNGIEN